MSFEGLSYDNNTYNQKLKESISPGMYQLGTPANDCNKCAQDVPSDPFIRWQQWGSGFCSPGKAVDVSSDLLGITRKASKCATDQYDPSKQNIQPVCKAAGKVGNECMIQTEPTRYSNPVCTMKEQSNNRWEWLCWDPQDRALIPFEWNVSQRIVVKDNHAPCIPSLMDQKQFLPTATVNNNAPTSSWKLPANVNPPPRIPQQTWQTCKQMNALSTPAA